MNFYSLPSAGPLRKCCQLQQLAELLEFHQLVLTTQHIYHPPPA